MIDVTVMFPNSDGATFDEEYYLDKHFALLREVLGEKLKNAEVARGVRSLMPGGPPAFLVITHLYFDSVDEFQAAFGPHVEKITEDERNFTNVSARVQISEVVK